MSYDWSCYDLEMGAQSKVKVKKGTLSQKSLGTAAAVNRR